MCRCSCNPYCGCECHKQVEKDYVVEVVAALRKAFTKYCNGAEGMMFERAVNEVYPFATDWLPLEKEGRPQG